MLQAIQISLSIQEEEEEEGENIARGTTDPEIGSETWTKLGNNMAPLALIANLATRWRHLTFSHLIAFSH